LTGLASCVTAAPSLACPNEALRSELHSGLLPDCRAYELVTPPYKEGATPLPFAISEDGSHVAFGSLGTFESVEGGGLDFAVEGAAYLSSRTGTGWVTSSLEPPESVYQRISHILDLDTTFSNSLWALGILTQPAGVVSLYLRSSNGSFTEIGAPTATVNVSNQTQYRYWGSSGDLSHVLFEPQGGFRWSFDTSNGTSLYEYVGTGNKTPSLVGVSGGRESTDLVSQCGTALGSALFRRPGGSMYNAISTSGARIFFTAVGADAPGCGGGTRPSVDELLVREELQSGQRQTAPISEPSLASCSAPSPLCGDARFEGASQDGSKVFFTSTRSLAEGASQDEAGGDSAIAGCPSTAVGASGCNLYEDELSGAGAGLTQKLVAVSIGSSMPQVQGVARISEDGSHVYFVAKGALTSVANSRGKTAKAEADNLYVYERDERFPEGHTSFIATLAPGDEADWEEADERPVQVSRDGRFLVLLSRADLTGEGSHEEGVEQVYQYDAQTESLVRASIGQHAYNNDGRTPTYNARLAIGPEVESLPHSYAVGDSPVASSVAMAPEDGAVFFASPTALTPQALNNQVSAERPVPNIYEYLNGTVYLLSDGRDTATVHGSATSQLIGASALGGDVFFMTADPLIAQDTDTQQDIYDARVNGGVAMPATPPGCSEDTCQGSLTPSPALPAPGSASQAPGGNLAPASPVGPKTAAKHRTATGRRAKKKHRRKRGGKAAAQSRRYVGSGR